MTQQCNYNASNNLQEDKYDFSVAFFLWMDWATGANGG